MKNDRNRDDRSTNDQTSLSSDRTVSPLKATSGAAMDRKVEKKKNPVKTSLIFLTLLVIAGLIASYLIDLGSGRTLTINQEKLVISKVTEGTFDDFIPVRGRVTPLKTVFLDAVEGGRVEERLIEDGSIVKAGDLIAVLSNTALQLDVTRNEAMVAEQLNNMRTIEVQLERNRLQHKSNVLEMSYQITRLGRRVKRQKELESSGVVIQSQLDDASDELDYFIKRRALSLESQASDASMQETQLQFLRASGKQLKNNVDIARKTLDALNLRAPVDGKLSGFDVEVGQSIARGGRLGQIDDPQNFKLRANIDEYYLGRVDIGQLAHFEKNGTSYTLRVAKIFPNVKNGAFDIDLNFTTTAPRDIRRGQTIQSTLTLGDATAAVLIPNGAFYQDTGGNWVFVITPGNTQAVKRPVSLGRRNSRFIEVLEGLEKGEQVITSPYSSFKEMDRLNLDTNSDQ